MKQASDRVIALIPLFPEDPCLGAEPPVPETAQLRLNTSNKWTALQAASAKARGEQTAIWTKARSARGDGRSPPSADFDRHLRAANLATADNVLLREQIMEAAAPDLEAVVQKLLLLTLVTDGVVWDFCDPETLAAALAHVPGSETTRAVAYIYLDLVRLAARQREADTPLPAAA
jgi:hypothetical protein